MLLYNVSTGVRFTKRKIDLKGIEEIFLAREPAKILPLIERVLSTSDRVAAILEYAETIAPAAETSFSTMDDRAAVVTLHRWSLLRSLEKNDSIIVVIVENLSDLHPAIVSNPRVATVAIPMPTREQREAAISFAIPRSVLRDVDRLAEVTAGLKAIQITSILTPTQSGEDDAERTGYLVELLAGGKPPTRELMERVEKLSAITKGMPKDEIRKLIAPGGKPPPMSSNTQKGNRAPRRRAKARDHRARVFRTDRVRAPCPRVRGGRRPRRGETGAARHRPEYSRGPAQPLPDGHALHRADGHRQNIRRRSVRQRERPYHHQAQELSHRSGSAPPKATSTAS